MSNSCIRVNPLNVLVVLADVDTNCTSMISGLRGHYSLICVDPVLPVHAIEKGFIPDVAIIDTRLEIATALANELIASLSNHGITCVALCNTPGLDTSSPFSHRLNHPVFAGELEQLFWRLSAGRGCLQVADESTSSQRQVS